MQSSTGQVSVTDVQATNFAFNSDFAHLAIQNYGQVRVSNISISNSIGVDFRLRVGKYVYSAASVGSGLLCVLSHRHKLASSLPFGSARRYDAFLVPYGEK